MFLCREKDLIVLLNTEMGELTVDPDFHVNIGKTKRLAQSAWLLVSKST